MDWMAYQLAFQLLPRQRRTICAGCEGQHNEARNRHRFHRPLLLPKLRLPKPGSTADINPKTYLEVQTCWGPLRSASAVSAGRKKCPAETGQVLATNHTEEHRAILLF
ncbi:hypothetical protein RHECNPAF_4310064 [Rhizobium etli CNPAF512]|nr:hypothetical protein RHECNPAF_4310064 [Rhizobium etli CNPAF512]